MTAPLSPKRQAAFLNTAELVGRIAGPASEACVALYTFALTGEAAALRIATRAIERLPEKQRASIVERLTTQMPYERGCNERDEAY